MLEAEAVLTALRDALVAGDDYVADARGRLRIRAPDLTLLGAITGDQRTALRASVERRLAAVSGSAAHFARAELPGVVTFTCHPSDAPADCAHAARGLFGSDRREKPWVDAVGRTHANVARATEVFPRREAQGRQLEPLRVAQAPLCDRRQVDCHHVHRHGGRTPVGRSVVLHAPLGRVGIGRPAD